MAGLQKDAYEMVEQVAKEIKSGEFGEGHSVDIEKILDNLDRLMELQ